MNRRSILRLLGLAPIAAPAAMAAASPPAAAPVLDTVPITSGRLPPISYDGFILTIPKLRITAASAPAGGQASA